MNTPKGCISYRYQSEIWTQIWRGLYFTPYELAFTEAVNSSKDRSPMFGLQPYTRTWACRWWEQSHNEEHNTASGNITLIIRFMTTGQIDKMLEPLSATRAYTSIWHPGRHNWFWSKFQAVDLRSLFDWNVKWPRYLKKWKAVRA
jgi:hypothetical protein